MSHVINVVLRLESTLFSTVCVYSNPHTPLQEHKREDSTQTASALIRIRAAEKARNTCSDLLIWHGV